jgi:hypothetical protein
MNFEELQVIWNSQEHEKMYVINEAALHTYIKQKGQSINRLLSLFEVALIGANLFAGIWLIIGSLDDSNPSIKLILSVFYLVFAAYGAIRPILRRKEEKPFEHTLLGELDKAIWRIDYLRQQGRNVIFWYVLPLTFIIGVMSFFNARLLLAFGLLLLVTPASYFAHRWEFNNFHLPKKHNLEVLRNKLIAQENQ